MTTQHTPGPWAFNLNDMGQGATVFKHGGGCHIATLDCGIAEEDNANARLIAAAPELLEALIKCTQYVRNNSSETKDFDETLDIAISAIAKARGE